MTDFGAVGATEFALPPPVGHVLLVANEDICARFGPMLTQVAQGLCASGVRTSLLTDDADRIARLERTPVECHWVPRLSGWRTRGVERYLWSHFATPPDLVHLWGTAGLWWVQRWAGPAAVPLLIHVLGRTDVERLMRTGLRDPHVATASDALAAPLLGRFPLAASCCRTLRPAVAPSLHPARERAAEGIFSVLCVSPITDDSGLDALIDAVAQLRRDRCHVQVGLVGDGPAVSAIWRHIRARDVRECVSLVDDPRLWEKVLPEVDACVVPACERELSIVPLLAMALGKIVIAARDQLGDWFIEGRTAWQFTPGSAVELAYLLARAIEQPTPARQLTAAATEYVRVNHSIRGLIAELLALYGAITGAGRGAPDGRGAEKSRE